MISKTNTKAAAKKVTKTRTPDQLIENISKDLNQLTEQAIQLYKETYKVFIAEHKAKLLAKHKKGYGLNPHRANRIRPDEIKNKLLRKEAKEVERKLNATLANLLISKRMVGNSSQEVKRSANLVIHNLQALDKALQSSAKWLHHTQEEAKLLRYERRNELTLNEKIFGRGPAKATSKKTRTKGDIKMTVKKGKVTVKELLTKLAKSTDPIEKKGIRVALRKLGHTGGLGQGAGRPKKKVTKKTSKKKTAKKKTTKKA